MSIVQIGTRTYVRGAPTIVEKEKPKFTYIKFAKLQPGDQVVLGKYVKIEMVPAMERDKPPVPKHYFELEDGTTVVLNSSNDLNKKLEKEGLGVWVDITYLGKSKVQLKDGKTIFPLEFEVVPLSEKPD